jgi:hypothetical protein
MTRTYQFQPESDVIEKLMPSGAWAFFASIGNTDDAEFASYLVVRHAGNYRVRRLGIGVVFA